MDSIWVSTYTDTMGTSVEVFSDEDSAISMTLDYIECAMFTLHFTQNEVNSVRGSVTPSEAIYIYEFYRNKRNMVYPLVSLTCKTVHTSSEKRSDTPCRTGGMCECGMYDEYAPVGPNGKVTCWMCYGKE